MSETNEAELARQANAALQESQQILRAIVDSTTAVIYIKDADGRYLLINRRFEELFHVRHEQALGRIDHDIFPRHTADSVRANDLRVLRAGRPLEFEEVVPHDDGYHTYISIKVPLQRASGGTWAGCVYDVDRIVRTLEAGLAALPTKGEHEP